MNGKVTGAVSGAVSGYQKGGPVGAVIGGVLGAARGAGADMVGKAANNLMGNGKLNTPQEQMNNNSPLTMDASDEANASGFAQNLWED